MAQEQERKASTGRGDPRYTWDDTVAAIGKDFSDGKEHQAQETIGYNDVVRYMEPWEISNPIYWDEEVAKRVGYKGQVVPWSAIKQTFTYRSFWRPGEPTRFFKADADHWRESLGPVADEEAEKRRPQVPMPRVTDVLVTEVTIDFLEPVCVGDRLSVRGNKLVAVRPRQTRVGFGAFLNSESEVVNQRGEVVARLNQGNLSYNPGSTQ